MVIQYFSRKAAIWYFGTKPDQNLQALAGPLWTRNRNSSLLSAPSGSEPAGNGSKQRENVRLLSGSWCQSNHDDWMRCGPGETKSTLSGIQSESLLLFRQEKLQV